jgi:hypothetical protein
MQTTPDGAPSDLARVPWLRLLLLLLASRLALLVVGLIAASLLPSGLTVQQGNLVLPHDVPQALDIWARWDSEWYLVIAEHGYLEGGRLAATRASRYEPIDTAGFLPLYPLLIRTLSPLMPPVAAGVLISNLSLLLAMGLLYSLAVAEASRPGRRGPPIRRPETAGLVACLALLLFPASLFLSAVYAESLLLLLCLASLHLARRGRFAAASLLAMLATLTRPFGILLGIPLVLEWWLQHRAAHGGDLSATADRSGPAPASLAWIALIPVGLVGFMLFCHRVLGDPLAFVHRQSRWRGALSGPWHAFVRWSQTDPVVHGSHGSILELVVAILCLAALPLLLVRLRPSLSVFATVAILLPLGSSLWSFSRLALTVFPLQVLAGVVWTRSPRVGPAVLVVLGWVGGAVSAVLMALFAAWWWAG